jgi:uncharacterized membrane protein YdbT with pleckstrin-like domain
MPYPKNLLNPRENLALDLRPHWWFFSKHILTGIPLFILWILTFSIQDNDIQRGAAVVLGVATIVWAIWLGVKLLSWLRTYFVVTDQRVVYRTGVIARHGVEIPLDRINNINFHQGVWERMIGAGDLDIQSAGDEGTTLFENVRHPDGVQQEVYRQMENDAARDAGRGADAMGEAVAKAMSQQQPQQPQGGGGGQTVPEQIAALADLRDKGHITPAEYEQKKAQLLEKM